jgi:serine/threonine protein kinase
MSIEVGTLLGRYEILGVIGRGNMGAVYEARDPKIERQVAIKTISLQAQEAAAERKYRERLFQEARAAGRLLHPGIVTIFDVGEDPESHDPFIVMEYVPGQSLDHLIESSSANKLPLALTLQLIHEVAQALDYAHSQGVIHLDIKPANILITKEGRAKIADFGIARLSHSNLKLSGNVFGSPAYMAPEQLAGEDADGRADLFALGVILYTMLTGHRPFQGNSAATVAFKLMHRPAIPVTTFEADLPKELDEIVFRAIAKDPDERYQSGAEFAHAVRQLQEDCGLLHGAIEIEESYSAKDEYASPKRKSPAKSKHATLGRKINPNFLWWGILLAATGVFVWFIIKPFSKTKHSAVAQASDVVPASAPFAPPSSANNDSQKLAASFHVEIEHHFSSGRAFIWLGGKPLYSQSLKGTRVKHALVFHEIKGLQSQDFRVEPGKHDLRVRIRSSVGDYNQTKTITANFTAGAPITLHITCEARQLKLDLR